LNFEDFTANSDVRWLNEDNLIEKGCLFMRETNMEAEKIDFSKVWGSLRADDVFKGSVRSSRSIPQFNYNFQNHVHKFSEGAD
jgi:hypothetical protein